MPAYASPCYGLTVRSPRPTSLPGVRARSDIISRIAHHLARRLAPRTLRLELHAKSRICAAGHATVHGYNYPEKGYEKQRDACHHIAPCWPDWIVIWRRTSATALQITGPVPLIPMRGKFEPWIVSNDNLTT
ncbi:hypothetical protein PUN4_180161 [Paraburkholderia unamae]|nr:hypothetical protein PUN4_180161 [Paraburkholderia unamae]